MKNNVYLDEFSQEDQINQAVQHGCLKLTLFMIVMVIVAILISVFSCGSTSHKQGCEAYGNGKTYNQKK